MTRERGSEKFYYMKRRKENAYTTIFKSIIIGLVSMLGSGFLATCVEINNCSYVSVEKPRVRTRFAHVYPVSSGFFDLILNREFKTGPFGFCTGDRSGWEQFTLTGGKTHFYTDGRGLARCSPGFVATTADMASATWRELLFISAGS